MYPSIINARDWIVNINVKIKTIDSNVPVGTTSPIKRGGRIRMMKKAGNQIPVMRGSLLIVGNVSTKARPSTINSGMMRIHAWQPLAIYS